MHQSSQGVCLYAHQCPGNIQDTHVNHPDYSNLNTLLSPIGETQIWQLGYTDIIQNTRACKHHWSILFINHYRSVVNLIPFTVSFRGLCFHVNILLILFIHMYIDICDQDRRMHLKRLNKTSSGMRYFSGILVCMSTALRCLVVRLLT